MAQPQLRPIDSLALDRHFLARIVEPDFDAAGVLRVYSYGGEVLSLGHYHRTSPPVPGGDVTLHRRLSGGRVLPAGDGFVGMSLIVPWRGALLGQGPESLQPYQALNRYVRGLLEACRAMHLPVIYPGLDSVTVRRLPFAYISMEETAAGALLFEAIIANTRDFAVLPRLLDAADRNGVIQAEMIDAESVTSLQRETAAPLSFEDVAERLRCGYEKQFSIPCVAHPPLAIGVTPAVSEFDGLAQRLVRPDLDHTALQRTQLGTLEVFLSITEDRIGAIQLAGDFIANSTAVAQLEAALPGTTLESSAIDAVVQRVVGCAPNFILGIGELSTLTQLIVRAAGGSR